MATKSKAPKKPASPFTEVERHSNNLIFGPYGGGKTTFLGLCSQDERSAPIMLLDFEGGVMDVLDGMPGYGETWHYHRVKTWDDFNEGYAIVEENDFPIPLKSVGIDSLSETHIFALMNILDTKGKNRSEPNLIQQDDYGVGLVQIRRLVRKFRDLPLHTYFTAHDKTEANPRLGLITMVNLSGKAATEIPGMMTVCGYLAETSEEGVDRSLLLHGEPKIKTKIRMPWGKEAPEFIDNPHPRDLLDLLGY